MNKIEQAWKRCYNACQATNINQLEEKSRALIESSKTDIKVESSLAKLASQLGLLSKNSNIDGSQKQGIQDLLQNIKESLSSIESKKSSIRECHNFYDQTDLNTFNQLSPGTQTEIFQKLLELYDSNKNFNPAMLSSLFDRFTIDQIKEVLETFTGTQEIAIKEGKQEEGSGDFLATNSNGLSNELLFKIFEFQTIQLLIAEFVNSGKK